MTDKSCLRPRNVITPPSPHFPPTASCSFGMGCLPALVFLVLQTQLHTDIL